MFQTKGMNTYYDQEKDRTMWQQAIEKRKDMIQHLEEKGISFPKDPQQMKMKDLERLLTT